MPAAYPINSKKEQTIRVSNNEQNYKKIKCDNTKKRSYIQESTFFQDLNQTNGKNKSEAK